jgi:hypothetical protein
VIFGTAKRIITLVVLGFAVLGFVGVPIFEKTGYEHLRDFLGSPTAKEASSEIEGHIESFQKELDAREKKRSEEQKQVERKPAR